MANPNTAAGPTSPRVPFLASTPGVVLCCTVCCILWGSAFPCIKIGYELFNIAADDAASQLLFAGLRFLLAGSMVIVSTSISSGRFLHPERRDLAAVGALSLFQTILQYVFFYLGLSRASGMSSAIIEASANFLAILLAALAFRTERLTGRKVMGCVVGFAGVALINLAGASGGFAFALDGEGFIFISTVAGAMSTCLIGVFGKKHDPVMLAGWQFALGGVVLIACGLAIGGELHPGDLAPAAALLVYMAFISAMAYSLWSRLLAVNPVSRVSVFGFMNPVFGVLLSAWLLGEGAGTNPLIALASLGLVCAGIIVVNRPGRVQGTTVEHGPRR